MLQRDAKPYGKTVDGQRVYKSGNQIVDEQGIPLPLALQNEQIGRMGEAGKFAPGIGSDLSAIAASQATPPPAASQSGPQYASNGLELLNDNTPVGPDGRPGYPSIYNLIGSNGQLKSEYQLNPGMLNDAYSKAAGLVGGVKLNEDALNELRNRAISTGQSPWEKLQLEKQALGEAGLLDKTAKLGATAATSAMSDLARSGGLSSGARERIAKSSARDTALGRQDVLRQGLMDRLGIGESAENQKLGILQNLPGMEGQNFQQKLGQQEAVAGYGTEAAKTGLETSKLNTQNTLNEILRQDAAKLGRYSELMKGYAADKTAQATANSGKK